MSKLCKSCQLLLEAGSPIRDENRKRHFDVIICPSNAGGTADTDISGLSHQDTDTKTLILIDNWDNFSSKYVMPFHPDKVVVWGEQTKLHAITLQGLRENSIRVMGTQGSQNTTQKSKRGGRSVAKSFSSKALSSRNRLSNILGREFVFDQVTGGC